MYWMGFYTLVLQFYFKKWAKEKKKMIIFWWKKTEGKQNGATIMIPVDRKWTVFPVKSKSQGE